MAEQNNSQTGASLSKIDAVRRALAHLGKGAMPTDIKAFIKQRFGIEMTNDHISVCKGELRRREAKAANKGAAPSPHDAPTPTTGPTTAPQSLQETTAAPQASATEIPRMDAMRLALEALGMHAVPLAIQGFLKERFDLDMTRDSISKYRSYILHQKPRRSARQAANKGGAKNMALPSREKPAPVMRPLATTSNAKGIHLEDIQTVKELVGRVGEEQFRKLIDLLGK